MSVLSKIISTSPVPSLESGLKRDSGDKESSIQRTTLDSLYRDNALLLADLGTIAGISTNFPLPVLGFVYEHPNHMELLRYNYSEYPYLNKTLITNSYTKEPTRFSVRSYRAITSVKGVAVNIGLNEALYYGIEYYCDRGGTFKLLTMWGHFSNLVLESLEIVQPDGNQVGGLGFEWRFRKIPFDTTNAEAVQSATVNSLSNGLV